VCAQFGPLLTCSDSSQPMTASVWSGEDRCQFSSQIRIASWPRARSSSGSADRRATQPDRSMTIYQRTGRDISLPFEVAPASVFLPRAMCSSEQMLEGLEKVFMLFQTFAREKRPSGRRVRSATRSALVISDRGHPFWRVRNIDPAPLDPGTSPLYTILRSWKIVRP
jgi:hypothetical protein